nr:PREDICTED: uncharacterized protein LOC107399164 [Tribolium castaneum]|eukprot:XP_015840356.1 PREDICTED: uncharacterized protein LOC107399164 [Tribolium castaneum]
MIIIPLPLRYPDNGVGVPMRVPSLRKSKQLICEIPLNSVSWSFNIHIFGPIEPDKVFVRCAIFIGQDSGRGREAEEKSEKESFRNKWKTASTISLQPGTLVILREDNLPPLYWQLGRRRHHQGRISEDREWNHKKRSKSCVCASDGLVRISH